MTLIYDFFSRGQSDNWQLREAQGAVEGQNTQKGHEASPVGTYSRVAKQHTAARLAQSTIRAFFAASVSIPDHSGHMVYVSVSPGNSGCCDCGDAEAWRLPVNCAIHTADSSKAYERSNTASRLPQELVESIRMTIGRAIDYMCDVISCSPEQLRLQRRRTASGLMSGFLASRQMV
jgi:E3 ubiquitin-protein ligase UBR1